MRAVVEFEHRYPAHRIDLQKLGLAIVSSREIDLLEGNVADAFFREKDAHAAWIRSPDKIVNFHSGCNLKLCAPIVNRSIKLSRSDDSIPTDAIARDS